MGSGGGISEAEIANEVDVMMSLRPSSHQHIIEILGHGSLGAHTSSYFIDMEYCDGSLHEFINGKRTSVHGLLDYEKWLENGHLSFFICAILQQILSGLIFIHDHGKVHRDLKPQNSSLILRHFIADL